MSKRVIKYTPAEMMKNGIRPGALRLRVAVLKEGFSETSAGLDDERQPTTTESVVKAGKFETFSAKEIEYFGLMRAKKPVLFLIRYREDIDGQTIIRYNNKNYRVVGLPTEDERRQFIFVPTEYIDKVDAETA